MVLTGFMAAGKSTVGPLLATSLGLPFVDLDDEIAAAAGEDAGEALRRRGELWFRAVESRLLRALLGTPRVVAAGGGAVLAEETRRQLRLRSHWVQIDVPWAELRRRGGGSRPLWLDDEAALGLWTDRAAFYAEAPIHVDGDAPPAAVRDAILDRLPQAPAAAREEPPVPAFRLDVSGEGVHHPYVLGTTVEDDAAWDLLGPPPGPLALISDPNVWRWHGPRVRSFLLRRGWEVREVLLPAGEQAKRMDAVLTALDLLLDSGWSRSQPIIALGGGVVGDMAGLTASLCLRGVPWLAMPTTVLAMADAAIGGKVAVDHRLGKNLIGAFHPPVAILGDLRALSTLPPRQLRSGLAEIVKIALAMDADLFRRLEDDAERLIAGDIRALAPAIAEAARWKIDVVGQDPREAGLRRVLNLGHTLGHAIEQAAGYGRFLHGEAVAVGLLAAATLAVERGRCEASVPARVASLLTRIGLPTSAAGVSDAALLGALRRDKKRKGDSISWVLPVRVGAVEVEALPSQALAPSLMLFRKLGLLLGPGV